MMMMMINHHADGNKDDYHDYDVRHDNDEDYEDGKQQNKELKLRVYILTCWQNYKEVAHSNSSPDTTLETTQSIAKAMFLNVVICKAQKKAMLFLLKGDKHGAVRDALIKDHGSDQLAIVYTAEETQMKASLRYHHSDQVADLFYAVNVQSRQ